jgi:4-oxalocrotonate tautomerase
MPTISVKSTPLSKEQKKELVERLTQVSVEVTGAPEQFHTVLIHELAPDSMGVGKKTVEEIVAEIKGKK